MPLLSSLHLEGAQGQGAEGAQPECSGVGLSLQALALEPCVPANCSNWCVPCKDRALGPSLFLSPEY